MEDYLAALMNQEFDTLVEDGSMAKVCACVCASVEWSPVRGVISVLACISQLCSQS